MLTMSDAIVSPVEVVLRLVGRPGEVARIVNRHRTAVVKWRARGDIPDAASQRALLVYAREHGIPLTAEHLIVGTSEADLATLLPAEVAA